MTFTHWIFLIFIVIIILTLSFRKPPILAAAIGLIGVGLADSGEIIGALQVSFRALIMAAGNLLPIILLIGIVVALTHLLRDTGSDQLIVKPLLKLRKEEIAYWVVGISMYLLTLLIWPTPAITLLGAVVIPSLARVGLNPLGLAVSLTLFGKGFGLAGDFVIQGAPSIVGKASGIPINLIISASLPVVLLSGALATFTGWLILRFTKAKNSELKEKKAESQRIKPQAEGHISAERVRMIAILVGGSYFLAVFFILVLGIQGDAASALIGGVSLLCISVGSFLKDGKDAFQSFIDYLKEGFKFSMGVFTPIVIMSSFFILGTKAGYTEILYHEGLGFFSDYAYALSDMIPLSKWTVGILMVVVSMLGSMDGSGFAGLPLVGGIAVALGEAANLPIIPLAVLGQIVGIWTGGVLIPWGFSAVAAAVTGVAVSSMARYTIPAYFVAIITAFAWTMFTL